MILYPSVKLILLTPAGEDLEILFDEGLLVVLVSLPLELVDCNISLTFPSAPLIPGSTIFVCCPYSINDIFRDGKKTFLTFKGS